MNAAKSLDCRIPKRWIPPNRPSMQIVLALVSQVSWGERKERARHTTGDKPNNPNRKNNEPRVHLLKHLID
ncbi:unnamed protein product [Tuber melanosporum]|uniref:(Perigord truffle) hypothetical protein n=1 Tax=Tuber melanosporum (strain Mel28) TaxID=656061 RepID=D5GQ26_TUBMM|nr:uncharacterized protein GSTUM_00012166001 [Tuber melanosporum]CAZ86619.1 unnamed protein product [Tuber melanosporum]